MRVTFSPVFSHVRDSEGIQAPWYKYFTAQNVDSCNSLDLNFGWCWFLLTLLALSGNSLICSSSDDKPHWRGASPRSPGTQACQCRICSRIQIFPQRKFSVLRTFSVDNEAALGSQSSCLCKAGLSHHSRIALGGEDLRMALGQRRQPSAIPTCPRGRHPPITPGLASPG